MKVTRTAGTSGVTVTLTAATPAAVHGQLTGSAGFAFPHVPD
jgi:hypothetical protein